MEKRFPIGKVHMGWHKNQRAELRRMKALTAHHGNVLATARALQDLVNHTTDRVTRVKARQDALYFFRLHKSRK